MSEVFDLNEGELPENTQRELRSVLEDFLERPLEKARNFDWESFKENETFKAVMMPSKFFWVISNFERSFTQKLGSEIFEKFARVIASSNEEMGEAFNSHTIEGLQAYPEEARKIDHILSNLEDGNRTPDWAAEKQEVLDINGEGGLNEIGNITWDLWGEGFRGGRALGAELKTPKPNKDQTIAAKRKMLRTIAGFKHREEENPVVRFVFPFNPYGRKADYNWWPPKNIFDVETGDGMMIAEDFWGAVGPEGTMGRLNKFLRDESRGNLERLKELAKDDESIDPNDFF